LFKKRIGQNFVDYLHHVRIRHACVLLKSTKMTVSEIAIEVGYGSFSTFSRVFREMKKVTPTDFRKAEADPYFGDAG
jgi:AraC-like DNA-binding protein